MVAGKNHHFKFIQTPLNIVNIEILWMREQLYKGSEKIELLELCKELGLNFTGCKAFFGGPGGELKVSTRMGLTTSFARHLLLLKSLKNESIKGICFSSNLFHDLE